MKAIEVLEKCKTSKIIKKIEKNKLNISLEEALMIEINCNRNDLVLYILNKKEVNLDYTNDYGFDYLSLAVSKGNIEAIDLLLKSGMDIHKKYKCGRKLVTLVYYVKDINTLKYLEKYIDKKEIKKDLESVVRTTTMNHNIELLDYILKNYKINLKKIKYNIQGKKYNMLDLSFEILQSMKNREYRKREMAFYISELLQGKRYKKIEKRAYEILERIEEENNKIEEYYKYIKKQFGVKK